jgi:hypothetical protein
MRRSRRIIRIALVFLLIGAAVNVGVAWGCILAAANTLWSQRFDTGDPWPRQVPQRWPPPRIIEGHRATGVEADQYLGHIAEPWGLRRFALTIGRAGWPRPALQWECWIEEVWVRNQMALVFVRDDHPRSLWRAGIDYPFAHDPEGPARWQQLPAQPLCLGFAVNTLLYAAAAAALWFGSRAALRWCCAAVRARHGGCPSCGYPCAGLAKGAACPECGS